MPAERRKKTKTPEDVPEVGDPDRKRVLNILAQRRYRERRREKIAALEAQAKRLTSPQLSDQPYQGGVQLEPTFITSSLSEPASEESEEVEDIIRNQEVAGFPMMDFGENSLDMQLFDDFSMYNLPSPTLPSPISADSGSVSQSTSSASASSFDFPLSADGGQLSVPILSAVRGFATIATTLNLMSNIWDPSYLHILPPNPASHLPPNLHPTPAQMTIPHHPLLDALPWPSVREKLICILALPSMLRPPIAQDEEGDSEGQGKIIAKLVHDLDDFKDGVRVHGNKAGWGKESELVEEAWEVGECFYRNWWWAIDMKVVEHTNRIRRERGAEALKIK